jgi:hypothetical protein
MWGKTGGKTAGATKQAPLALQSKIGGHYDGIKK